jgi:N-acetylmuramoyl-L-alanine amidase
MPSVIVEVGFLSNPREEALLSDESYQARVAYAIFSGIVKYNVEEAK